VPDLFDALSIIIWWPVYSSELSFALRLIGKRDNLPFAARRIIYYMTDQINVADILDWNSVVTTNVYNAIAENEIFFGAAFVASYYNSGITYLAEIASRHYC
jgi:hypothetical protein